MNCKDTKLIITIRYYIYTSYYCSLLGDKYRITVIYFTILLYQWKGYKTLKILDCLVFCSVLIAVHA